MEHVSLVEHQQGSLGAKPNNSVCSFALLHSKKAGVQFSTLKNKGQMWKFSAEFAAFLMFFLGGGSWCCLQNISEKCLKFRLLLNLFSKVTSGDSSLGEQPGTPSRSKSPYISGRSSFSEGSGPT